MVRCSLVDFCMLRRSSRNLPLRFAILVLLCASPAMFPTRALGQEGTFVPTGSMNTGRSNATATLLNNGMVLFTGIMGAEVNDHAELYDPVTGTFSFTGSMLANSGATATLLNN
jgi:hypothetical protein